MPKSGPRAAKRFFISGRVQGVGFRYFASHAAHAIGVAGYVRNLADGRVEVYAVAAPDQLAAFEKELAEGPRLASVAHVDAREEAIDDGVSGFSIRD